MYAKRAVISNNQISLKVGKGISKSLKVRQGHREWTFLSIPKGIDIKYGLSLGIILYEKRKSKYEIGSPRLSTH